MLEAPLTGAFLENLVLMDLLPIEVKATPWWTVVWLRITGTATPARP